MTLEPEKYTYNTQLRWESERKGILSSNDKPDITVATPPEFDGHVGIWSPEDLFLASVEVCALTTFLWFVNKEHINLKSYGSEATGTVERVDGKYGFSSIDIELEIKISSNDERLIVEKVLKKVLRACLISNSIKTVVHIKSKIHVF